MADTPKPKVDPLLALLNELEEDETTVDSATPAPKPAPPAPKPTKTKSKPAKKPVVTELDEEIDCILGDLVPEMSIAEMAEADESPPSGPEFELSPPPKSQKESKPTPVDTQVVTRSVVQQAGDPAAAVMALIERSRVENDALSKNILNKWEGDREQLESTIQSFITAMGNDPNTAARPVVEGLVSLLETKINSTAIAVKLFEANNKMMAALKGTAGVVINNQNIATGGNNVELTELLSSPVEDDMDDE